MKWLYWFLAGAFAVPFAHHLALAAFFHAGVAPYRPYSWERTKPFGVPQVFSLMFWGGVWGLILGLVLARVESPRMWWIVAIVFGAIAPTLVAGIIVRLRRLPMKPTPMLAIVGLVVNAAWGVGTGAFYRLIQWLVTSRN